VGCSEGYLRPSVHWSSREYFYSCLQSGWSVSCHCWSVFAIFPDSFSTSNVCIGEDLAINLWDLGSGRRIKKMTGHTSSIYSMAFSAESSLLVSGGSDWTVRCWDVKSAGGLPQKPRENGMVVDGVNDHTNAPKDELGIETSVLSAERYATVLLTRAIVWTLSRRSRRSGRQSSTFSSRPGICVW
jgi:WD40 repeat protein